MNEKNWSREHNRNRQELSDGTRPVHSDLTSEHQQEDPEQLEVGTTQHQRSCKISFLGNRDVIVCKILYHF